MGVRAPNQVVPIAGIASWIKDTAEIITAMQRGRHNNVGIVTLTASATSTTLTDPRIAADSAVLLVPTTATAAAEMGTLYISETGRVNGAVVITHSNTADADKTFRYTIIG